MTIVPEIQWHPRHPTSYVISVFTIEDRILKELERLIEKAEQDPNAIFTDDNLPSETYDNSAIKQIWKERINAAIKDWKNTLEWASPDFNPPEAITKEIKDDDAKKKAKEKAKKKASTTWDSIAAPLNSNSNVFGKRMKAKIDEVYGEYSRSAKVGEKEYEELENLWEKIPDKNFNQDFSEWKNFYLPDMPPEAPKYGASVIKP